MRTRSLALCALAACLAGPAVPADEAKPKAPKYESPQAVFEAAKAAGRKEDWKAFCGCLSKDSLDAFAGGVAVGGALMVQFAEALDKSGKAKEQVKPIAEALKKHGVTIEDVGKAMKGKPKDEKERMKAIAGIARPIADKPAFVADMMAAMKKADAKGGRPAFLGTLEDVKVEGDRAEGTVVTKKGADEEKVKFLFVKEGGGWKLVPPLGAGKGGKKRPAPGEGKDG